MTELEVNHGVATIFVDCEPTCTFDIPPGVRAVTINGVAVPVDMLFAYWNIDATRIQSEMWSKEVSRRFKLVLVESGLLDEQCDDV